MPRRPGLVSAAGEAQRGVLRGLRLSLPALGARPQLQLVPRSASVSRPHSGSFLRAESLASPGLPPAEAAPCSATRTAVPGAPAARDSPRKCPEQRQCPAGLKTPLGTAGSQRG